MEKHNDPNQASHPDGRLVLGLLAARALLRREAERYADVAAFSANPAKYNDKKDALLLADELLRQKMEEILTDQKEQSC